MDEWDMLIRDESAKENVQKEYIDFLRGMVQMRKEKLRKKKLRKKQCLIIAMSILTVPFNNIHHVQAAETDQQYRNLEKLCLVWGYTKYRHPVFLSGQKDWDEELLNLIDPVSEASNDDEVNKILYEWFEGLGDTDYGTDFYDLSWENAAEDDKLFLADTTWRDDPEYLGEDLSSALMEN